MNRFHRKLPHTARVPPFVKMIVLGVPASIKRSSVSIVSSESSKALADQINGYRSYAQEPARTMTGSNVQRSIP